MKRVLSPPREVLISQSAFQRLVMYHITCQLLPYEWLHVIGGHNKVEYCSGSHLKDSSFRSKDLSLALALSVGRGLRRIVARVRGVLGAPPPKSSTVASCG